MTNEQVKPSLGYREAAAVLRMSVRKLERLVAANAIPFVRIGRQVTFDPDSLERWRKDREQKPKE